VEIVLLRTINSSFLPANTNNTINKNHRHSNAGHNLAASALGASLNGGMYVLKKCSIQTSSQKNCICGDLTFRPETVNLSKDIAKSAKK